MNTPFATRSPPPNAITLMLSLAREIPQADASTQPQVEKTAHGRGNHRQDAWRRRAGNIGSIVADRAQGLKMKVIAFDPFLSPERARTFGVEKVELDELFQARRFHTCTPAD